MLKKLKENKNLKIILSCVGVALIYLLYILMKPNISFNRNYETLEYGNEYTYEDFILKTNPHDAEIISPDFKATEVGKYTLPFTIKSGGRTHTENFTFKIEDTKKPIVTLYYQDVNVLLRLNNTSIDPLVNIHKIENVDPSILSNKKLVTKEEYDSLKESIKETNKLINSREISKEEDIIKYDVPNNFIFYMTDLDRTKVGVYPISVCIVDDNYNLLEVDWKIEVVDSTEYLSSGGNVTCSYNGNAINANDAYYATIVENYKYSPFKFVEYYEIINTMTLVDDYDTDDNLALMLAKLKESYNAFNDAKGVTVSISSSGYKVTTKITVDLTVYDKEKDPLNIMKNKKNSEIEISTAINDAKEQGYVCTIK